VNDGLGLEGIGGGNESFDTQDKYIAASESLIMVNTTKDSLQRPNNACQ
jgi:hypothetical protein